MSWHGLVTISEIEHIRNGQVIWRDENIKNTLHMGGELYILTTCFNNTGNVFPPLNYYFGLDNRPTIAVSNLMSDLQNEPTGGGYARVPVGSVNGQFQINLVNNIYRATSNIISFSAVLNGNGWGPVKNLFLTTTSDNTGVLIASNQLSNTVTMQPGDSMSLRMALSLQDISVS